MSNFSEFQTNSDPKGKRLTHSELYDSDIVYCFSENLTGLQVG